MSASSFKHLTVKEEHDVAVVDFINADVVFASDIVQEIGDELHSLVKSRGYKNILLNFQALQYISSTMLAHLARLQKEVDQVRGHLKLAGMNQTLQDIFKIGHFDRIFAIYDDELSAIQAFH